MILQELHALALREKLLDDTAFSDRPVTFVVRIDRDGSYRGLEPNLDERGKSRKLLCPREPVRTVGVKSAFLVDNTQYTLRLPKVADGDDEARIAKKVRDADERAKDFDALVAEAARDSGDEQLAALQKFLARRAEFAAAIKADAPTRKGKKGQPETSWAWTGDEVLAFAYEDDLGRIDEREAIKAWWRARTATAGEGSGPAERCLVTGALTPSSRTPHPKVKNVPDGQSTGTSLISCNADAFKTLGQDDTDPISAEGAEAYVRALNWLLEREGERRFRQGVLLDPGSVVVFWTREPNTVVDALLDVGGGWAESPSPDEARRMLEAPWRGVEQQSTDATAFFALTLGGNSARVVVRDWFTATAEEVKHNLRGWFDDLRIDGDDDRPVPLRRLLEALQSRPNASKDKGDAPPDLSTRMFRAALHGTPLPAMVLAMAVQRFRVVDKQFARERLAARAALLRCALNRKNRSVEGWKEISMALDPTCTKPGYVLGRLFALLEQMQLAASGQRDVNATVRDRYFGAASSTPGAVFPVLLRLSAHHGSKLARDGNTWLERQKSEVMDLLPAERFPPTLDLDAQGLFALGYYHQRQERFRKRTDDAPPSAPATPHETT